MCYFFWHKYITTLELVISKRNLQPLIKANGCSLLKSANERIKYEEHLQVDKKLEGEKFAFYVLLLQLQTL